MANYRVLEWATGVQLFEGPIDACKSYREEKCAGCSLPGEFKTNKRCMGMPTKFCSIACPLSLISSASDERYKKIEAMTPSERAEFPNWEEMAIDELMERGTDLDPQEIAQEIMRLKQWTRDERFKRIVYAAC